MRAEGVQMQKGGPVRHFRGLPLQQMPSAEPSRYKTRTMASTDEVGLMRQEGRIDERSIQIAVGFPPGRASPAIAATRRSRN